MAILVPKELEGDARAAMGVWPPSDMLRVIVEPRLTPATSWYVVARGRGLVIGSLSGRLAPSLQMTRQDPMGVKWLAILDFATTFVEHRTWARGTNPA